MPLRIPLPDHYRIETSLSGGPQRFAGALRVRDLRTDCSLALKTYRPPAWMTAREAARHRARIVELLEPLTQLACAGLAPVREVADRDGMLYVARDYVPGVSVAARLRDRGSLPLDDVHAVTMRVAATIDRLAADGLSHGALTPENVILADDGAVVVTDAAFEPALRDFTLGDRRCRLQRRAAAGEASHDVRALAALAFRALTGCELAPGDRADAVPCTLPWAAREALRRALAGDRRAFRSATELAEALWPGEPEPLFRQVWRPAAAMGLLGALATVGTTATSEQHTSSTVAVERALTKQVAIPEADAAAEPLQQAKAPATPFEQFGLSADDALALRDAMARRGVALLANSAAATAFQLTDGQRQLVDLRLTEERVRVNRIVNLAAAGKLMDTATPMSQVRTDTEGAVLRVLTAQQRALWDSLESQTPSKPAF